MLFPGRMYIAPGPWHLGNFCNIFLPNTKVLLYEGGTQALSHMANRRWSLHYVHKKLKRGPEVATFGQKTVISPWLYV